MQSVGLDSFLDWRHELIFNRQGTELLAGTAIRHNFLELSLRLVSRLELPPVYFILARCLIRHGADHFRHLNVRARVVLAIRDLIDSPRDGVIILANVGIPQRDARHRGNRINVLLVNQARIVHEAIKDQSALRFKGDVPQRRTHVLERQRIIQHRLRLIAKAIFIRLHDEAGKAVVGNVELFHEYHSRPVDNDAMIHLHLIATRSKV